MEKYSFEFIILKGNFHHFKCLHRLLYVSCAKVQCVCVDSTICSSRCKCIRNSHLYSFVNIWMHECIFMMSNCHCSAVIAFFKFAIISYIYTYLHLYWNHGLSTHTHTHTYILPNLAVAVLFIWRHSFRLACVVRRWRDHPRRQSNRTARLAVLRLRSPAVELVHASNGGTCLMYLVAEMANLRRW